MRPVIRVDLSSSLASNPSGGVVAVRDESLAGRANSDYNDHYDYERYISMSKRRYSWSVAEAKAHLSDVIERARNEGPQEIARRGKRTAVVVSVEEWDRKTQRKGSLVEFLAASPLRGSGVSDREKLTKNEEPAY